MMGTTAVEKVLGEGEAVMVVLASDESLLVSPVQVPGTPSCSSFPESTWCRQLRVWTGRSESERVDSGFKGLSSTTAISKVEESRHAQSARSDGDS